MSLSRGSKIEQYISLFNEYGLILRDFYKLVRIIEQATYKLSKLLDDYACFRNILITANFENLVIPLPPRNNNRLSYPSHPPVDETENTTISVEEIHYLDDNQLDLQLNILSEQFATFSSKHEEGIVFEYQCLDEISTIYDINVRLFNLLIQHDLIDFEN